MSLPSHREHRTALVIDIRDGVDGDFKNRYQRLLESVNGSNIKVDVLTLTGNTSGPSLVSGAPTGPTEQAEEEIDLDAWAAGLGYTMLLVASPVVATDDDDDDE